MRKLWITTGIAAGLVVTLTGAAAATGLLHAGPRGDGTAVTPVGFLVTPAGRQTTLGSLPLGAALSPDGRHLLVTNNGQGVQSLQVLDLAEADEDDADDDGPRVRQSIAYASPQALFVGVAYSADGTRAYASAGGNNKIRRYTVDAAGALTEGAPLVLPTTNPSGQRINPFPAGLAVAPGGGTLYVADQLADALSAVDVATGSVRTVPVGHNPLAVALTADGRRAYVTNQGGASVTAVDTGSLTVTGDIPVGSHPNHVVLDRDRGLLYVSVGDEDRIAVIDAAQATLVGTIDLAPYRGAAVGSNPGGLALSPDGARLYVANSGNNDVAMVDTRTRRTAGLIPTGWYPSAVVTSRDGRTLHVLNAKGLGAGPNDGPGHPDPYQPVTSPDQYIGSMIKGTLSTVRVPDHRKLAQWTRQVFRNNDFEHGDKVRTGGNPARVVPIRVGAPSPIKHAIYVVKENRTYDQVFGSLGRGAGDPSLNLFGDESAPNSRELARRYATLDNFYADAEVSAQGWNWSVAANSNQYVEAVWPATYSGRNRGYDYEGGNPATAPNRDPRHAYIWHRLADAGVSFRDYGFYATTNGATDPADPVLGAHTNRAFAGYDLRKPDHCDDVYKGRMCEWLREFHQFEATGDLPAVEFVRLPNDHTAGTSPGAPTPKAYVADNDYALGQLVDAVSHSRFWSSTAIFITEDDAQNGPDHIDAHRTVALVVSPYTQTGRVDSTFYSTVSMLRTMELVVGIRPMTQFDTFANAMHGTFTDRPNARVYDAILPTQPFTEVNPPNAPMAAVSAAQPLDVEDRIDERTFNQAIWQSVKGAGSVMPEPQHRLGGHAPEGATDPDDDD